MPTKTKQSKSQKISACANAATGKPKLRFPGFSGGWEEKKLGEVCKVKTGSKDTQDREENGKYPFFVRSNTVEKINSFSFDGETILTSGDGVGVGKNFHYIVGKFDYHQRVYSLNYFKKGYSGKFIYNIFSNRFHKRVKRLSAKNSVDSVRMDMITDMKIYFPAFSEQQKIAGFLGTTDEWIENLRAQKENLESYKKGMMQKIFSQEVRFKDDEGNDFAEWEEKRLGDCLDYEQPTNYIVKSTEYNNSYKIPVLTAGKSFILGYTNEIDRIFNDDLPVIIFDDFTTTSQFVDFPFKVKSSAMKILKAKAGADIKFVYESMQLIKYEIGGHGRHWISKFSNIKISMSSFTEQQKIANFLTSLDNLIESKQKQITQAEQWKRGLMQGLFV